MKKILVLTLVLLIALSLFAGCREKADSTEQTNIPAENKETSVEKTNEKEEQKEVKEEKLDKSPITLKYWAYSRWRGITGKEPDGEYGDFQQFMADAFTEAYPNVTIEFEHLPFNGGPEKVNVAIASQINPDILEDGTTRFFGYAERGVLLALDDYVDDEFVSDYKEGTWDKGKYTDGKHYMFPWAEMVIHLLVNNDLFEKAGAANLLPQNEEKKWTYDEFEEALRAVTQNGVYGVGLYAGNEQGDSGTNALMWGYGATLFDDTLTKITFNSPEGIKGVEYAKYLSDQGLTIPSPETLKASDTLELFKQQKVAIYINGHSGLYGRILAEMETGDIEPFDIGWAMYPTAEGVDPAFYANPTGVAVFDSGNDERNAWAVELAKFVTSTENSKGMTPMKFIPVRKSVGNIYEGDPLIEWSQKAIKYSRDPGLAAKGYTEVRAVLFPEMQAVYAGIKSPTDALNDFAKNAQEILDKYNEE